MPSCLRVPDHLKPNHLKPDQHRKDHMPQFSRPPHVFCIGRSLSGGGAERVQIELITHLKAEARLTVFYMSGAGPLGFLLPPDVEVVYGSIGLKQGLRASVGSLLSMIRLARRADLLFGMQDTTPIYLAAVLGRVLRTPSVGWIHNTWSRKKAEVPRIHSLLVRLLYPLIQRFVAVSDGTAQSLVAELPALRGRVQVIYNPLDRAALLDRAEEGLEAEELARFSGTTFVALGRLEPVKGFDLLIEAFSRLAPRPGLRLLIVGEGSRRDELTRQAQALGVGESVMFVGFRANPYPYLKRADAFVLSSRFEGLGMVLVEALLLGRPLIAADCESGPREILEGGQYGWLVPPDDVTALAGAMQRFLDDPAELQALAAQGLDSAGRFDPARVVEQFSAVFAEVLARPDFPARL